MAVNQSFKTLEQSHYDLTRVPSLESNRLVGFINHFSTVLINNLRELEQSTDSRFMELERRIKICRKSLQILESRLDSIPFLKSPTPVVPSVVSPKREVEPVVDENVSEKDDENIEPVANTTAERDPRLEKFYKMLKVGVPLEAVKIKMSSEDIDPSLLVV